MTNSSVGFFEENYFNATITKIDKYAIFYIVFSENLTSPKMNQTFSDLEIDVNIQRSFEPLKHLVDFNWTILRVTTDDASGYPSLRK